MTLTARGRALRELLAIVLVGALLGLGLGVCGTIGADRAASTPAATSGTR